MEITVEKKDLHESRLNSLNKYRSMMTLDIDRKSVKPSLF